MKKFLFLIMLFTFVRGTTFVKAGNVYGHLTAEGGYEATWNAETETMGWNSVGNSFPYFRILLTGLPSGDITEYKKFHATLSNFSDNATYVRLRIKSNDGSSDHYADANLVAGENNIDLVALRAAYPDCDFTKVVDITIWSPGSAEEGKTVDADHPASVKIQNVYMQRVKNVAFNSLGDEITKLSDITDGSKFIIANSNGTKIQTYVAGASGASETSLNDVSNDMFFMLQLAAAPDTLDVNQDETPDGSGYYSIGVYNTTGTAKPSSWWGANYICRVDWGDLWTTNFAVNMNGGKITNDHFGRDHAYSAVWTVAYEEGKGFKFYNPQSNKYMNLRSTQDDVCYLRLYKSFNLDINSEFDKENNAANDDIFALADATGYNAETGILKDGGWTFETPVDLSNWDYLIITVENTSRTTDTNIKIMDNDGKFVEKNQYDPGSQPQMYFGTYNNHNAACISMDYLRINKGLDISHIKSLSFEGQGLKISSVYLTDYDNTKLGPSRGRYTKYVDGDVVRNYDAEGVGKFGTICLPYVASCAGAEIYSIVGKTGSSISLSKVTGLLEAGKPYFYKASDETGSEGNTHNVNFFRADLAAYDAAAPVANNGLIGTENFAAMTAPAGPNYYILSGNQLYNTEGCTGSDAVTVGANKAYIDFSAINVLSAKARAVINFGEGTTDINQIDEDDAVKTLSSGKIYDLSGREVARPTRGFYMIGKSKVWIK